VVVVVVAVAVAVAAAAVAAAAAAAVVSVVVVVVVVVGCVVRLYGFKIHPLAYELQLQSATNYKCRPVSGSAAAFPAARR